MRAKQGEILISVESPLQDTFVSPGGMVFYNDLHSTQRPQNASQVGTVAAAGEGTGLEPGDTVHFAWDVTADPDNRVLYGDVDVHRAVAEKKGVVGQVYAKISEKGIEPLFGWCYVEPVRKTTTFMEYSGEELLEDRGILRFAEDGSLIGKMVFFPSECASVNSVNGVNYYVLEHKMIVAYED